VPECCSGDPEVVGADEVTTLFQETENLAVMPSVGFIYQPKAEARFGG
jgi:hypothetical protein